MKQKGNLVTRGIVLVFLITALLFAGAVPAFADGLSFSDVSTDNWAYGTIMKAVDLGLFQGTSSPVNGVGTFSPNNTMTRAEFITVCVRAVESTPTGYKGSQDGLKDSWYDGYWDRAVQLGLIESDSFGGLSGMGSGMSRQEMAYAAINTLAYLGETPDQLLDTGRIPDMNSVTVVYQPYVLRAYSMGILCGVDTKGTFSPNGTLNRAQAATVLVRLLDKGSRQKVDFTAPVQTPVASGKWVEGQKHGIPKAGDIVVKADGTEVVLTETKIGNRGFTILGLGQGVDCWSGTTVTNSKTGKETTLSKGMSAFGLVNGSDTSEIKAIGSEVHTGDEWKLIFTLPEYSRPTGDGSYYGEVRNSFWVWTKGETVTNEYGTFTAPDLWSNPFNYGS